MELPAFGTRGPNSHSAPDPANRGLSLPHVLRSWRGRRSDREVNDTAF